MTSTKRPSDDHYWRRPWSSMLFAGDLFEAIPFSSQPTVAVEAEDEDGARKHYLYLPPVPGTDEGELVGLLFRPTTVDDDFLRTPPRRLAQLHPLARRHLKVKLAAYWARAGVDPDALPIFERDEEIPGTGWPPSEYDPPDNEFAEQLPPPDWDPDDLSSGLAPRVA